jgi:hypothetical protein
MLLVRAVMMFALLLLVGTSLTGAADPKKKGGGVVGTIVAVTEDKDNKDNGTITIKTTAGEEKVFKYTKDTRYWKSEGPKKEVAAVFAELTKGTRVTITATKDVIEKIVIQPAKKN